MGVIFKNENDDLNCNCDGFVIVKNGGGSLKEGDEFVVEEMEDESEVLVKRMKYGNENCG